MGGCQDNSVFYSDGGYMRPDINDLFYVDGCPKVYGTGVTFDMERAAARLISQGGIPTNVIEQSIGTARIDSSGSLRSDNKGGGKSQE